MKTIIAGSRTITDYEVVKQAIIESEFQITEVVSGAARGVDRLGERWAQENGVPVKRFPADWKAYPKFAGIKRNAEMGNYAEALIAIWDGRSRGTENMIKISEPKGLKVFVVTVG